MPPAPTATAAAACTPAPTQVETLTRSTVMAAPHQSRATIRTLAQHGHRTAIATAAPQALMVRPQMATAGVPQQTGTWAAARHMARTLADGRLPPTATVWGADLADAFISVNDSIW